MQVVFLSWLNTENDPFLDDDTADGLPALTEEDENNTTAVATIVEDDTYQKELSAFLEKYDPPLSFEKVIEDQVDSRFRVHTDKLIPALNSMYADAYTVTDTKEEWGQCYALICGRSVPFRDHLIPFLKKFEHPHLVNLVTAGRLKLDALGGYHYVLIYQKPRGIPLSQVFEQGGSVFSEQVITRKILTPLAEIISAFTKEKIFHGRINPDSLYWDKDEQFITLGECVSEPAGCSQPFLFEAMERLPVSPLGKGEQHEGTIDVYALGILTFYLLLGRIPFEKVSQESYMTQLLNQGLYSIVSQVREFSGGVDDLFKGVLNETPTDRWSPEELLEWIRGRRFHSLPPASLRESSRGFEFAEEEYFSRKALATGLFTHWDEAKATVADQKLLRWIELSLHKKDAKDNMQKVLAEYSGDRGYAVKRQNEMIASVILLLDPEGILRLRNVAVYMDGVGVLLADTLSKGETTPLSDDLLSVIESNLTQVWTDAKQTKEMVLLSNAAYRLENARGYLRYFTIGFGIERCLYELVPTLPCQSPLIEKYQANNLKELLVALDQEAAILIKNPPLMDRHIVAFVAQHISLAKELRISRLMSFPALNTSMDLLTVKLLQQAQERTQNIKLVGLTCLMAARILPLLNNVHNKELRVQFQKRLVRAAKTGSMEVLLSVMTDKDRLMADQGRFERAGRLYAKHSKKIHQFRDTHTLHERSKTLGINIAMHLARICFITSLYLTVKTYMG